MKQASWDVCLYVKRSSGGGINGLEWGGVGGVEGRGGGGDELGSGEERETLVGL